MDGGQIPNIPPRRPLSQKVRSNIPFYSFQTKLIRINNQWMIVWHVSEHHVNVKFSSVRGHRWNGRGRRKRFDSERNDLQKRFLGIAWRFRWPPGKSVGWWNADHFRFRSGSRISERFERREIHYELHLCSFAGFAEWSWIGVDHATPDTPEKSPRERGEKVLGGKFTRSSQRKLLHSETAEPKSLS